MKNRTRREAAQKVAHSYAPLPRHSLVMYGLVGIVLAALALFVFGGFYGVNMTTYPLVAGGIMLLVAVGAATLWVVRKHRHHKAHRIEYDKTFPDL